MPPSVVLHRCGLAIALSGGAICLTARDATWKGDLAMAIRWITVLVLAVVLAAPAPAARWAGGCPKVRWRLQPFGRNDGGGVPLVISRNFEHVGHEVTFHLRDDDVTNHGGFSTEPGGNTLEVTFKPDKLVSIPLPPIQVTATSPSTLTIVVPDSRPILGRLLVGPAEFRVRRGTQPLFHAFWKLILPPMNDIGALTADGYEVEAYGTLDRGGRLWVPLGFRSFGTDPDGGLAACPTELTPVTAFALGLELKKGEDQALPYISVGSLKGNKLYLGDYLLDGKNMYGNKLQTKLAVVPKAEHGVVLCSLNDALELVLMVKLRNPALGKKSELLPLVQSGSAVRIKVHNISADLEPYLEGAEVDSNNEPCYSMP
jgi:hypothetical protein